MAAASGTGRPSRRSGSDSPRRGSPRGDTTEKGGTITLTYDILVKENDVAGASSFIKRQMEQGYDFELSSVKETKIDDVI